jgi:hypothetical protein
MAKGELKDKMNPQEFRDYLAKVEAGKNSKFRAIPTTTADGQTFKSILESAYYNRMWVLQRAGEVTLIEREVRYELIVNGVFIAAYMMDFRVTYADGHVEYVDCKSTATKTPLYLIKKQLMLALYGIELKEVFE